LHNVEKIFSRGFRSLNIMSQYNAQCSALKDALPKDKLQHTDIHTVISSQGNTDNLLYIHLTDLYNQSLWFLPVNIIWKESLNNRSIIPPISTNQTIPYNFNSLQIQKKYNDHAGRIFFQLFKTDFSYFLMKKNSKVANHGQNR
jgi:hypothetical protein